MELKMAALISSRIQVRPISRFDTRITVEGTTVKLRYNVFLGTEKIVRYIRGTL